MRIFKKIIGFLGFANHDDHDHDSTDSTADDQPSAAQPRFQQTGLPRRGFAVPVQIVRDRPHLGPILSPSSSGDGGIQGLGWYAKHLRIDEDGDVADKFFEEVYSETLDHKATTTFKLKRDTRPVKVKKQILSSDGKFQQFVEHQGRSQWV